MSPTSARRLIWADARTVPKTLQTNALDFVVMNPPFHDGGHENQALGQSFIEAAAADAAHGRTLLAHRQPAPALRDDAEARCSSASTLRDGGGGFKIFEAQK